ncbi:Pre-rRNA-processing protein [Yarrowia sp. C11]|nr:Pre-rRNA-processing protein [Yarrowia sp. C11]KAG5370448.1 Pre-rRNA-processing protein [Yarrowia sp. E02]
MSDILEIENSNGLKFGDSQVQGRFELGVCMVLYNWTDLATAVDNSWGGADSEEKREWLVGNIVELFEESTVLDALDIQTRLSQVMEDEFDTVVDDDSDFMTAQLLIQVWMECSQGIFTTVENQYNKYEKSKNTKSTVKVDDQTTGGDDSGDEEDDDAPELVEGDVEMDDSTTREKQGPIIDEDGFEVVQRKGRR